MDTTTAMLLTGVVVTVGRWARKENINSRIVIALIILALFLSLIGETDEKLASRFGLLILLTAVFGYGGPILTMLGYTKKEGKR